MPELLDISKEPQAVRDAYGVKPGPAGSFARQCLMARSQAQRGGYVQLAVAEICQPGWGPSQQSTWRFDRTTARRHRPAHRRVACRPGICTAMLDGHPLSSSSATNSDGSPPARVLMWPRSRSITGYPMWLAGAGVKKGFSFGAYRRIWPARGIEGRMHTTDLHATRCLGAAVGSFDHERLTYRYAGRDFRLTDVAGKVFSQIFS